MPTYTRLNVSQLCELCRQRGIVHGGLAKRRLIDALLQHDNAPVDNSFSERGDEIQHDGELGGDGESSDADSVVASEPLVAGNNAGEPESVVALRLRLALAREERLTREKECEAQERAWQIERERYELQGNGHILNPSMTNRVHLKDIKSLLPTMTDIDILSFF